MDYQTFAEPLLPLNLPEGIVYHSTDDGAGSNGAIKIITPDRFDYGEYDAAVATEIRDAADRIRFRGREQNAAIAAALRAVKEKVGHGNWSAWLSAEFGMSISTAGRYMRVAERFGTRFVTVTNLQPGTQYLLAEGDAGGGGRRDRRGT